MQFLKTKIPDCFELIPLIHQDERGCFVKTFSENIFIQHGLTFTAKEEYFSISNKGVLRGMHFQTPPHHHKKLVYCIDGVVLDVLVDLRVGSPVYGVPQTFQLDSIKRNMLFIAEGVAHGFYTLSDQATLVYKTSTIHAPQFDAGVLWSSFDVWPVKNPHVSDRDQKHLLLKDFQSPFKLGV